MHEDSNSHGKENSKAKNFKQSIFVLLLIALLAFAFVVYRNIEAVLQNAPLIILTLVIIYLVAKYDYLLMLYDYERAVIFRFGKVNRVGGPGWALILPPIENYKKVDLRTKTIDIPKQDVVTKDNIEVEIDAVVYLKVRKDNSSVINSVVEIDDYVKASELFVLGLIRAEAGKLELTELIARVDDLDKNLKKALENISSKWGVQVEEAVIQDVHIPKTVLDAMHEQKAAIQKKLARIEAAQGHQAEIEAVKAAAEKLNDKALAYYYLKALEKLGESKSTKIIFPMELSNLAKSIGGGTGISEEKLEELMKKYAPALKSLAGKKPPD